MLWRYIIVSLRVVVLYNHVVTLQRRSVSPKESSSILAESGLHVFPKATADSTMYGDYPLYPGTLRPEPEGSLAVTVHRPGPALCRTPF